MRTAYRFVGREGDQYVWQARRRLLGDSRVEEVRCGVDWFWSNGKPQRALVVP